MKIKILILFFVSLVIFITSCSKLKDDIASPGKIQIHSTGYADTTSAKFHGKELKTQPENIKLCLNCHGYNQTINLANKSCYTCHNSYPHKPNWINPSDATYHGKFLKGLGYTIGMCSNCHGDNYKGGTSNISCYGCHESYPHNPNWKNASDQTNYHGGFIASMNWIMGECKNCHGSDLKGGTSEKSCFTCHSGPKGPEECNTCHGDVTRTINADSLFHYIAPPKGVFGESATSNRAVGAHQVHLLGGVVSSAMKCQECHLVPTTTYELGHLDSQLPAEVLFRDSLANTRTGNIIPNPSWDSNNLTCQNTYCHGNFELLKANSSYQFIYTSDKITGLNKTVKWTKVDGTEAACGSCHGLPPAGHLTFPLSSCGSPGLCHAGIVDSDGKIIDKKKHINGKFN